MTPQTQPNSAPIEISIQSKINQNTPPASSAEGISEVAPGKSKGKHRDGYRPDANQTGNGIDWFRSITRRPQEWPPKELTHKMEKTGQTALHLVLLDTSASTLSQGVFVKAKGVILDIAHRAYLAREQIAILGFGQDGVSSILPRVRAPKEIAQLLENLGAGGGTPFRIAIENAGQYLMQQHQVNHGLYSQTYILTDGRTQADVSDLSLQGNTVLIDTENSQVKRGRGQSIAQDLGAQYVLLNSILETAL
jgi:magnesium chelatase subunit D